MATEPAAQNVTFPSAGATAYGYLALPPAGHGPGVVVIQEWWGLTGHIKDIADRLARAGFVALAPDLYGKRVAHDAGEAGRLISELPTPKAVELLSGAVGHLLSREETRGDTVGAVGFCMGGGFVLSLAAADRRVAAAVPFYGLNREGFPDFSNLKAQIQGHYGELDESASPSAVEELRAAIEYQSDIVPVFHLYPAGHAFFNDTRPGYDAASSAKAWERTIGFLRENLPAGN
ncbi:dienelactone hydrolase family protein [Streptomyces sp. NPDC088725]|uniref:dienelactone hydrolase family protein n=1 Tax=Streptomyces sp. NPDC088725 TaxID=3365873 RepID=UPI003805EE37